MLRASRPALPGPGYCLHRRQESSSDAGHSLEMFRRSLGIKPSLERNADMLNRLLEAGVGASGTLRWVLEAVGVKRRHTGARSRKHGCSRCGRHTSVVITLSKKSGRKYTLCPQCAKKLRLLPTPLTQSAAQG